MPYSNFRTLDDVKEKLGVNSTSAGSLFTHVQVVEPSQQLVEILAENVPLALNMNTEKARSELIISPVLVEVRKQLDRKISFFSGPDFNVDEKLDLTGYCDFLISRSPDQVFIESPVVCVVEAKNESIRSGYAQCIATMFAAKLFNERNAKPTLSVLGVVTTGSNWKFIKLADNTAQIDFDEYLISQIDKILGILIYSIRDV